MKITDTHGTSASHFDYLIDTDEETIEETIEETGEQR